jgi:hypothetical protein
MKWEVRKSVSDEFPSREIEAHAVIIDKEKSIAVFTNEGGDTEALIALTPGMTITKKTK